MGIHAHRNIDPAGRLRPDFINDIDQEPGPILKASAVKALAGVSRQQFGYEIAVTAFNIHGIKAYL